MKIITIGNPLLETKSNPVDDDRFDEVINFANEMMIFVDDHNKGGSSGVGLSAVQVGMLDSMFIMKFNLDFWEIVINPLIISTGKNMIRSTEGCMSNPGVFGIVPRHRKIKVKYINRLGEEVFRTLKEHNSIIFQHECDHTQGICCWNKFTTRIR